MSKKMGTAIRKVLYTGLIAGSLAITLIASAYAADLISGQVTKVDVDAGKITIKHGAIKKFDMDHGMTMVFKAADPAMLNSVKAGDKIMFDADKVQGQFTVTKLQKAK